MNFTNTHRIPTHKYNNYYTNTLALNNHINEHIQNTHTLHTYSHTYDTQSTLT